MIFSQILIDSENCPSYNSRMRSERQLRPFIRLTIQVDLIKSDDFGSQ